MSKTAIIIPCYNEANRLKEEEFLSFLALMPNYYLYFVDDGSTDATYQFLKQLESKNTNQIFCLQNPKNIGKGETVRNGMLSALKSEEYNQIGFLDADLSTPLTVFVDITNFLIHENRKAVFGSRLKIAGTHIDRSPIRHVLGRFIATLISWTIQIPFYDTQCGAKVFTTDTISKVCKKPFISRWFFDVEIILRMKKLWGENIYRNLHEYPIQEWKQVNGSKVTILDGIKAPFELWKVKRDNR
ncbi:MAG: glycosyltransferase [Brumimicrobium sp.]|nr:glycosyltransferase [Brumimicrobium sp.]